MDDDQIELLLAGVGDVLGEDVVGAYLFGSAVLGGLRPRSDVDVMVVSRSRTTRDEKRRLAAHLLGVSRRPRPVELTIVVRDEIRPWRYPPRMDFKYGDWWRDEFDGAISKCGAPAPYRRSVAGCRPISATSSR